MQPQLPARDSAPDAALIGSLLEQLRAAKPVVHNITNFVSMDIAANALLALGASPIMAHAPEELEDLLSIAGALVLNIGTLDRALMESCTSAAEIANRRKLPVILDPVGAGASSLRTEGALSLLRSKVVSVLRGNASEIAALAGGSEKTKGVDSTADSSSVTDQGRRLAQAFGCVTVVSGKKDFILNGEGNGLVIENGHVLMPFVTALGCTTSSFIGAFAAVTPDFTAAAACGMIIAGIAGELAAEKAQGPGSFRMHFIDALYSLDAGIIEKRARIEVLS